MYKSVNEKIIFVLFVSVLYAVTGGVLYLAFTRSYDPVGEFDPMRRIMLVLLAPLLAKYAFQLICSPFYSLKRRIDGKRDPIDEWPSVSVLIPAWNEEVGIVKTLQSVLNTDYPKLQIIVINDGSTDCTHEMVTGFAADNRLDERAGLSWVYLNLPNGGKAKAMNRGLCHAEGEIVVTIDADSVMDPEAISNLVVHFSDPAVGGVAGNVAIANRKKPIEWIQQLEYLYGFFFKRADSLFNSVYIIGGAAAAYRREVINKIGGFDHTIITEDIELSTRLLSEGYKTRYAHDAVIYTEGPAELNGLCRQRLRWKYGRIMTFLKHRKLFFSMKAQHNPYLCWLILPIAVYAELLLFAEVLLMSAFIFYTVATSDYMPLVAVTGFLAAVVSVQILMDPKCRFHRNLFLLAPVAWLVFYSIDLVEFQALLRSIKRLISGKELKWQKWARVGVLNDRVVPCGQVPAIES